MHFNAYQPIFDGPYEEEPQEKAEARRAQRPEEKPFHVAEPAVVAETPSQAQETQVAAKAEPPFEPEETCYYCHKDIDRCAYQGDHEWLT